MFGRRLKGKLAFAAVLLAGGLLFHAATRLSLNTKRASVYEEMHVVLPPVAQLLMTGGDQYLAAHLSAVRALVSSPNDMTAEQFKVLGLVQRDAARFNPLHFDNYFIAAAVLPWYGEVDAGREVLRRAAEARTFDSLASFHYAFLLYHFDKDPIAGAAWLEKAAERATSEEERLMFVQMASSWLAKASNLEQSIAMIRGFARQAAYPRFRDFLNRRADRLELLRGLRQAADTYRQRAGQPLVSLDQLVTSGVLPELPVDPFRRGFALDDKGTVVFAETLKRKPK